MSDEKMVSERDAVLRERAAFRAGCELVFAHFNISAYSHHYSGIARWDGSEPNARIRYPLPTVTRPRVVKDPMSGYSQKWRCVDGKLQFNNHVHWVNLGPDYVGCCTPTHERITMWADLLANPTETVDE